MRSRSFSSTQWLYLLIILAALMNASGLFVTILAPDGALYASIAKNMVLRSDYIQLFGEGREWLDKPHFPFWITALSFRCFGFTTWAYKLPALLFVYAAAAYTYLFAGKLYTRGIALWAVLILLTAEHIVISNNDVRAEPYLTALIVGSVYHFYRNITEKKFGQLLLASLLAACAVMTKGMMALVPIGGAIAGELIIKKKWTDLFNIRWLIAGMLTGIFIVPELYSLYYQFDAHPEKIVFGRTGVSGIRFFFWDSQFGRFFNTGPIKGKGDPFFFLHTTLWAFLPWSVILYVALVQFVRKGWRQPRQVEWYCISGSVLLFLLFSASKFQLPHYLNIVFPFFAILTAQYLMGIQRATVIRSIRITQSAIVLLMAVGCVVLDYYWMVGFDQARNLISAAIPLLLICLAAYTATGMFRDKELLPVLLRTALASILVNLYLNLVFYPKLLRYQSGSEAAFWINRHNRGKLPVVQQVSHQYAYALEFYLHQPLYTFDTVRNNYPAAPFLLYIYTPVKEALLKKGWQLQPVKTFDYYPVSKINGTFLSYRTREAAISTYELVLVQRR